MRVLITGATGLLGGHLIKQLQQRGEDIRALVLPVENADKLVKQGVGVVRGDITDASTLAPAVTLSSISSRQNRMRPARSSVTCTPRPPGVGTG